MLRIIRLHRPARLSSVSALLLSSILAVAQSPAPRIRGPIELTPSVPLEGSLDPHVRLSDDLGPLAPDTPIPGITLVFSRSAAQEADLQQLLARQTDPSSPLFHHWLTPADFAARFGTADADIAATQTWLQSHGFTIDALPANRDRITFSGTAAQVQQAFGAELHRLRFGAGTDAELHFAPATDLSLPPALASVTAAVLHLSDFRPKPNLRTIRPHFTTTTNQTHFLSPADLWTMYDLNPLSTSVGNFPGTGQSIAIVGQSYVPTTSGSALANFEIMFAGDTNIFPVFVPGSGVEAALPGEEGEADIDIEYSSGIASSASILYVFTGSNPNYNVFDALAFAITQDIAPVVSISYGGCEPLMSTADLQQANALFAQAAAQGQTLIASSGDAGATACAPYSSSSGVSLSQQQQLAVSFPASSPYVTAVGGTQMAPGTFAAGTSTYWAGASSSDNFHSLLSYVPEVVWNESSPSFGISASGGGASSYFPRPSWQTGVPGIPSGGFRLLPDVALQSSITSPGYIVCSEDSALSGSLGDCGEGSARNNNNKYVLAGGTSFAAPIFAGFIADLNQYTQSLGQGNINPTLYSLAAQPSVYASAFHDITSGTTACAAGDGNCGTPGQSVYAATTGYDMATGLGSLDFSNLATAWPSTSPQGRDSTGTLFFNDQMTATAGAQAPLQILVGSSYQAQGATVPTGTVSLSLDGNTLASALPFTTSNTQDAQAGLTYTITAPTQTGSHIVIARYSGDATHSPSVSTWPITVGNLLASGSFVLSASNLTLPSNTSGSTALTITPSGGYNGALTWTVTLTGGTVATTYCYLVDAPTINGTTAGTLHFGVGSACSSLSSLHVVSPVQRSSITSPPASHSARLPAAAVLALLLFGLRPSRRRKILPLLSVLVLATIPLALTGCGGGSSNSSMSGGGGITAPQPQVYTVTLQATDSVNGSINASTSFSLTVN